MELSKYNVYVKYNKGYIVYNTLSYYIAFIEGEPDALLTCKNDELINYGILVNDFKYEEEKMIRNLQDRFRRFDKYRVELMVTQDCNLTCSYCYQQDRLYNKNHMSDIVKEQTITFINNLNFPCTVTFYGGEPLLNYETIIYFLEKLRGDNTYSIITNGTLLSKSVIDELSKKGIKDCQITIDGNRDVHDKRRHYKDKRGSFDDILTNLNEIVVAVMQMS